MRRYVSTFVALFSLLVILSACTNGAIQSSKMSSTQPVGVSQNNGWAYGVIAVTYALKENETQSLLNKTAGLPNPNEIDHITYTSDGNVFTIDEESLTLSTLPGTTGSKAEFTVTYYLVNDTILVTHCQLLVGDYNHDGYVDIAHDFMMFRNCFNLDSTYGSCAGMDHNEDGIVDFSDFLVFRNALCSANRDAIDLNGDGVINKLDYDYFQAGLAEPNPSSALIQQLDFNHDGQLTSKDTHPFLQLFNACSIVYLADTSDEDSGV